MCTSSTHAELGTRSAHGPLALAKPPAANSTNNGRGSTPPLFSPVYQPAKSGCFAHCSKIEGGWSLVHLLPFLVFRFLFFCSMNTNRHREKNTSGGRRSFGWVVNFVGDVIFFYATARHGGPRQTGDSRFVFRFATSHRRFKIRFATSLGNKSPREKKRFI